MDEGAEVEKRGRRVVELGLFMHVVSPHSPNTSTFALLSYRLHNLALRRASADVPAV